ncbi:signal transduction histidine kinase [Paenochrobactrum gallinarii]|uniref:histidine kinase n=1 Tax=Paenochrobactrum gallinarii TaxID=643673 RepID=A0A841LQG7_9HYPH|nr:signal transduction histidine kinase [Paenochrobactrum gallinarii]
MVTLSTLWVIVALVVVATLIGSIYKQASERNFERLLWAHLYNLVGSVSVSENGDLQGRPELGEIRYSSPTSGWYWEVDSVSSNLHGTLHSLSLGTRKIWQESLVTFPFDSSFKRTYPAHGPNGEELFVAETEVVLDSENRIARFRVMGNLSEVKQEYRDFNARLYSYLGIFGIGSILINAAVILFGLRPLDRVRRSLADIREGRAPRLTSDLPIEIAPLAQEMNALIENNVRIMERSRTQVGNLAHSLKTPLTVLMNEGRALGGEQGRIVTEQCEAMQLQIQHYLQRARIAAQRDSVVFRTPVTPVLERIDRVTKKLNPQLDVRFSNQFSGAVFAGEKEDLEEVIGNLMENAGKWGHSQILMSLQKAVNDAEFMIIIEDDGPGLAAEKMAEAMQRGRRIDETKPGTGLGLAIVQDTVKEYGGQFVLKSSQLGGLRAQITLPLVKN